MYAIIAKDIGQAARFIQEGRIVAIPTGTAYALACDALQGHALQRLRTLKQRPQEKTFTVFMEDELMFRYFVISKDEQTLWEKYQGQPLTLLLKPKPDLEHLAQDDKVGLRIIDHPLMQQLADVVNVPLTATSANISGAPPAYTPEKILEYFPGTVAPARRSLGGGGPDPTQGTTYNLSLAAILDGGTLAHNPPTTIGKLENGKIEIIRPGKLQPELG
ncbi:MAG: L-threonylcarbamoyladenylate synthase [Patescibacteria group bacterium]